MTKISKTLSYNGKPVATVDTVRAFGINLEIVFTNGYRIVVPPSVCEDEVLALAVL